MTNGIAVDWSLVLSHWSFRRSWLIPPVILKAQLKQAIATGINQKQDDEKIQECCGVYQTQLIVGFALLEGAAFFNLVALMVEHCAASIAIVAVLLLLMVAKFPTRDKVSFWVQDKLRKLQLM